MPEANDEGPLFQQNSNAPTADLHAEPSTAPPSESVVRTPTAAQYAPTSPTPRTVPSRKLYQDEVYGTKELSPLAVALIDAPEFQRLSHIYQLGFTYTVFRGATHPRFDHSVGTYFVVRTLLRRIVQNHTRFYESDHSQFRHPGLWLSPRLYLEAPATPTDCQLHHSPMGRWRGLVELVSAAALLHDLGHVPAGHTMEDEFTIFKKHDSLGGSRLFEMLYGPRQPVGQTQQGAPGTRPQIEQHFGAIQPGDLPRPEEWQRVPLPWVFEDGIYDRFFPDVTANGAIPVEGLKNWEIRDLIYLLLSFKETFEGETGRCVYKTFGDELDRAREEAEGDLASTQRIAFIKALFDFYSRPVDAGPDYEALPLFHPFMSDVIANTICADLLDYLVRDGKRLKLDIRDNPRLQRYLLIRPASSFVTRDSDGINNRLLRLTINAVQRNGLKRRDTVSDLMDLMRERYRFAEVVYYHPKKAAFSTMLAKAIEILEDSSPSVKALDVGSIYPAPWAQGTGLPPKARHICHFGDESLLAFLGKEADQAKSESAATLVRGILSRSEYRLAFTLDYEAAEAAGGTRKVIQHLRMDRDGGRKLLEKALEELVARSQFGLSAPVLIYCPQIRMQAKEVAAHVELTTDKVIPLNLEAGDVQVMREIEVLNEKYPRLWRLYVFVHPRLALGQEARFERGRILSVIVDTFCSRFEVPEPARVRGARFKYIPFAERLIEQYNRWQQTLPSNLLGDERALANLRGHVNDLDFWAPMFTPDAPFPLTNAEYDRGFALALTIVAADSASPRQKEEWPDELLGLSNSEWYRQSSIPKVEHARKDAVARLTVVTASMRPESQARDLSNWGDFVNRISANLNRQK